MVKLKGLGRGLDALLSAEAERPGEALQMLNVDLLEPGRYQPRTRMDEASLAQLADSISVRGVMDADGEKALAAAIEDFKKNSTF